MANKQTLLKNARAAAKARGHNLSRFQASYDAHYYFAYCQICARAAFVTPKPYSIEVHIIGAAVSVNCDSEDKKQ